MASKSKLKTPAVCAPCGGIGVVNYSVTCQACDGTGQVKG